MMKQLVIVGAGHAGFQLAVSLRQGGYQDRIVLINDEPHLPYHRPPLSKAYLEGGGGAGAVIFRSEKFFLEQGLELVSDRAVSLDRVNCLVNLASGSTISYSRLVLATGARSRPLDLPNCDREGVLYLRGLDDAEALRQRLAEARRVIVIGAGFIGLEFSATARRMGLEVDVVEYSSRVMARAVTREVSKFFCDRHMQAGVRFHFGLHPVSIEGGSGHDISVGLNDGRRLSANLVVVGIGVTPNTELAEAAGLRVAEGVIVDSQLTTADPKISAIGDCALFPHPRTGAQLRLESVQNATDQARCVTARITGKPRSYDSLPWFWSDQANDKLQIAGLTAGYETTVVRGDPAQGAFSVFCYKSNRLIGIESVNRPSDHIFGRRILAAQISIRPEAAADLDFDLKTAAG